MSVNSISQQGLSGLHKHSGFTLIEIMVALLVITIALGAVINTTTSSVETGAYLRDKTLALWVAQNFINDIVIEKKWPDTGVVKQSIIMNKKSWTVRNNIIQTANSNMRKLDVAVYTDTKDIDPLVRLTAFISRSDSSRVINIR